MPRFLSRLPYGAKTVPLEEFAFEEDTEGADHSKYVWSNAAFAMGVNITRSFKLYGWCARIRGAESGGMVEGLPVHTFPTDDTLMCDLSYCRNAKDTLLCAASERQPFTPSRLPTSRKVVMSPA